MAPYAINFAASAAAATPADVAWIIYTVDQEYAPTAFLQWHQGTRGGSAQIALLHFFPSYVTKMGLTVSLWDYLSFVLKGYVTCSAVPCVKWHIYSLHQIGSMVHVLTHLYIDALMALDPDANLL